jgi:hypothetical protein
METNGQDHIAYVGRSKNIRARVESHRQFLQIKRVLWMACAHSRHLSIEREILFDVQPPLNKYIPRDRNVRYGRRAA